MSRLAAIIDGIEETSIAVCLGLMTLTTFANVVARYVFDSNILWALELTVFLFAWLVLMGASYGVKKRFHIGVDIILNAVSPLARKTLGLVTVAACLVFSVLLLVGAWEYWYPFVSKRAFLETDDIPMPEFLQFLADALNEGERYEKLPRFIPYLALPLGMALLTWRFVQTGYLLWTDRIDSLIVSHETDSDKDA